MDYIISGSFRMGGRTRSFLREESAESEEKVREKIYTLFGSEHKCKRHWIKINDIKALVKE